MCVECLSDTDCPVSACNGEPTCHPTLHQCLAGPSSGGVCDDGDACTGFSYCDGSACVGIQPVTCPEPDSCHTQGACEPASGCPAPAPKPDGAFCDDGDPCTQQDRCLGGACAGAEPVECPDAGQCYGPSECDSATGQCSVPSPLAAGAFCDDGDACTQDDRCQDGVCLGAEPIECPGAGQCYAPSACDPATGQCLAPPPLPDGAFCDDGDACTDDDRCIEAVCGGTPRECENGFRCDEARGTCRQRCELVEHCAVGKVCDREGRCVDPPPRHGLLEQTCAVAAPGGERGAAWVPWLGLAALAGLAARRGRRSPAAPGGSERPTQGDRVTPSTSRPKMLS